MNVISDARDGAASCVDYPDDFIFRTERERIRPDEQRRHRVYNAVAIADGIGIQTLPVQDQPSNEALHLLVHRQRTVLLREIDLNVRQDFNAVGAPRGPGAPLVATAATGAANGQFIPNLGDYYTRIVADLDNAAMVMGREPRGPYDEGATVAVSQTKALAVQDQFTNS